MTRQELQTELLSLPKSERISLAHWLLATVLNIPTVDVTPDEITPDRETERVSDENPLLKVAGIFSSESGDSTEQADEILAIENVDDTLPQQIDNLPEEDNDISSLEDFMAEIRKMPPTTHLFVSGDGRLAEYLANPVIEPDPDFDVAEWNLQWQVVETQMKEEESKYERLELDQLQRLMS